MRSGPDDPAAIEAILKSYLGRPTTLGVKQDLATLCQAICDITSKETELAQIWKSSDLVEKRQKPTTVDILARVAEAAIMLTRPEIFESVLQSSGQPLPLKCFSSFGQRLGDSIMADMERQ